MNVHELWWANTLLRIESIAHLTIHLLNDRALTRVGDAAERLTLLVQDVKAGRVEANQ